MVPTHKDKDMRANDKTRRVWAIPLASKGFVAVGLDNPVFWYLADFDTDKVVDTKPHASKRDAECQAVRNGWECVVDLPDVPSR